MTGILLLTCFEFLMALSYQSFENGRSDTILVKLISLVSICCSFDFFTINNHFLRNLLLRVFAGLKTDDELANLALSAVWGTVRASVQVSFSVGQIVVPELRQVEENLDN